jgi:uncharacterized phage protein (TIGR01671 family)
MREIKFRGKEITTNEWVYGNLVSGYEYNTTDKLYTRIVNQTEEQKKEGEFTSYEVIPETVGQFIGLYDKNRVEIYKGDIITGHFLFNPDLITDKFIVQWNEEEASYEMKIIDEKDLSCFYFTDGDVADIKVIGNIYENPELLEYMILDEIIKEINENQRLSEYKGVNLIESAFVKFLLEKLRPYIELAELFIIINSDKMTDYRKSYIKPVNELINKIKELEGK